MKRYGKCVGKVPHSSKATALRYIKNRYLQSGIKLRFYECPGCLDYHITSKPPFGPMEPYYKRWDKDKNKPTKNTKLRELKKSRRIINKQWAEFSKLFRNCCHKHGVSVLGYERTHKKKLPTILKGVLPREERLRIFAELEAKRQQVAKSTNLWTSIKQWVQRVYNIR